MPGRGGTGHASLSCGRLNSDVTYPSRRDHITTVTVSGYMSTVTVLKQNFSEVQSLDPVLPQALRNVTSCLLAEAVA